jgi:hypothetical protein
VKGARVALALGDPGDPGCRLLGVFLEAAEVLRSRLCSARVAASIFIDILGVVCGGKVADIRTDGTRITHHAVFGLTAFQTAFFLYCRCWVGNCLWFEGPRGFSY